MRHQVEANLRALIDSLRKEGSDQLPPLRELASSLGASPITVQRACRALEQQGLLFTVPRHGVFIRDVTPGCPAAALSASAGPSRKPHRWLRVKDAVERDIISGALGRTSDGAPYAVGAMMRRYHVSYRTMRKALDSLVADGLLSECTGGYRREQQPGPHRLLTVVLILPTIRFEIPAHHTDTVRGFAVELERQCNHANLNLHVVAWHYDEHSGEPVSPELDALLSSISTDTDSLLAFVIHDRLQTPATLDRLLSRLLPLRKPVAIVEDSRPLANELTRALPSRVHWFDLTLGALHGKRVGQYLAQLGHRRVAYFSLNHRAAWSRNRYRGLCHAFEEWGGKRCVVAHTTDRHESVSPAMLQLQRKRVAWLMARHVPGGQSLYEAYEKGTLSEDAETDLFKEAVLAAGTPLFEAAIADKAVTAWVAGNDIVGVGALEFLRTRRVKLPRQLALVSFDNTYWSLREEISSYDFGLGSLARSILTFCLDYARNERFYRSHNRTVSRGIVIHRRSSDRMLPVAVEPHATGSV